jgi:hypothetical protein
VTSHVCVISRLCPFRCFVHVEASLGLCVCAGVCNGDSTGRCNKQAAWLYPPSRLYVVCLLFTGSEVQPGCAWCEVYMPVSPPPHGCEGEMPPSLYASQAGQPCT